MKRLTTAAGFLLVATVLLGGCGSSDMEPAAATRAAGTIEGTYRYESTRTELEKSPLLMDQGEVNDGNWGTMTLVLNDGKARWDQVNRIANSTSSGTYTTKDGRLALAFTAGDLAGNTFTTAYQLVGDTLTLTRLDGAIGPTPLVMKPWTRLP